MERDIKQEIRLALGRLPDLTIWNNPVGNAIFTNASGKASARVPYGLVRGASDILGILEPTGRWFCLEIKSPGARTSPARAAEQRLFRELIRKRGGFAAVVTSLDEAMAAYIRAKQGACQ
jgi:hypothetical protein